MIFLQAAESNNYNVCNIHQNRFYIQIKKQNKKKFYAI